MNNFEQWKDVWDRAVVKYGVTGAAIVILAIAILFLLGVIDLEFVMELIHAG